ncbi:Crp/Fnr family transcriptional regulator [Phaeocystidibacter luteus]|uniref:Crp/Fnr family transcriptional regulator n=1 Tax=Phaeocystidibacter luteus TaxID=911197 RepID=A0A6N6RM05_9FLAO|nr:Crp/Fnr family transcriptional regulator [Phaeocystidibacter luteus]KAB2814595.1 Crp/Fnr family transcriptional regulator [Phaeocystidibacter luteus]
MIQADPQTISSIFPLFTDQRLLNVLADRGTIRTYAAGDYVMDRGMPVEFIPLLLTGSLRIMRRDDEDKELLLYYLRAGETCASSLTCCMGKTNSEVEALAEEDTEVLAIPSNLVDEWMEEFPEWKAFVMRIYHDRFQELLETIDAIAFQQLDERLMRYFNERIDNQGGDNVIKASHQEIANDLHSSREVISRLLKQMEKNGMVTLGRNRVEVLES